MATQRQRDAARSNIRKAQSARRGSGNNRSRRNRNQQDERKQQQ